MINFEDIIGLWASETHFLIIRGNLIEFCLKNQSPIFSEYPRIRYNSEKISISDSVSIYQLTNNDDDMYFDVRGVIIQMNRMHR